MIGEVRSVRYAAGNIALRYHYSDVYEMASSLNSPYCNSHKKNLSYGGAKTWAGGDFNSFSERMLGGPNDYSERADRLMHHFTNVALATLGLDLEYNTSNGMLDYEAMMAGEPDYLFGMTETDSEQAPIKLYMDQWISAMCSVSSIERRGIACLALVQALGIHRPVQLEMVMVGQHTNTGKDVIITMPVPVHGANLSLLSWMVGSCLFTRAGFMMAANVAVERDGSCNLIPLRAGVPWQTSKLGAYLAEEDGIESFVHVPMMFNDGHWNREDTTVAWIKSELKRLLGPAYMGD